MYNTTVVQYLDGYPIRTFSATVVGGRITASALLRDTGFENTAMYEDHLRSHFLSRNTTFATVGDSSLVAAAEQQVLETESSFR